MSPTRIDRIAPPKHLARGLQARVLVIAFTVFQCGTGLAEEVSVGLVRLSHVGYLTEARKVAKVVGHIGGEVAVRRISDGTVVLRARLGQAREDVDSGDRVADVDFSQLTEPGVYVLEAAGGLTSDPFPIGPDVYAKPFRLAMRSYTGQRCGTAISLAPDGPQFNHPACHTADTTFDPSSGRTGTLPCTGGWHDAGDFGRYVVNSGITTATLLWAYELNAAKLETLQLDLPESGRGTPDMLQEIRWNLDWMLKMQDSDGGVWHKASSANFPGMIAAEKDTLPVLIIGSGTAPFKTTAATADFAAVLANAARIYAPFDAPFADRCSTAAEKAWEWLEATPDHNFTQNPPGIQTGGYEDGDPSDERLWAAAELFRATGNARYNEFFRRHYGKFRPTVSADRVQGWPQVANLAMYAYAMSAATGTDAEIVGVIRQDALIAAEQILARAAGNGYAIPLRSSEYYWGSNSVVANYGMMLVLANRMEPRAAFSEGARDVLHYLFGRNTFSMSYVTGVGIRWPMHPHHRPSFADGVAEPWPGLLVGGPNAEGKPLPARQWVDLADDYRRNETAINWNAPLVLLLAENLPGAQAKQP